MGGLQYPEEHNGGGEIAKEEPLLMRGRGGGGGVCFLARDMRNFRIIGC